MAPMIWGSIYDSRLAIGKDINYLECHLNRNRLPPCPNHVTKYNGILLEINDLGLYLLEVSQIKKSNGAGEMWYQSPQHKSTSIFATKSLYEVTLSLPIWCTY